MVMKKCSYFDNDDIGIQYATWKDRGFFDRDDSLLSEDERKLKERFLDFEKHYFNCQECSRRLQQHTSLGVALEHLYKTKHPLQTT